MLKNLYLMLLVSFFVSVTGCKTAGDHAREVRSANDSDKVTVGKVQAQVREGMSGAEVAEVLGSPNIVTTDEERREVWIYDKFATETIYSESSGGVNILFLGGFLLGDGAAGGGVGGSNKSSSGASSKTQRTMTIIIKFGEDKRVRDFAYHSSSF
tara:strand:+ start:113 stop:577 length:465 start_codon:yes stop_codon:yes gene_type:complete